MRNYEVISDKEFRDMVMGILDELVEEVNVLREAADSWGYTPMKAEETIEEMNKEYAGWKDCSEDNMLPYAATAVSDEFLCELEDGSHCVLGYSWNSGKPRFVTQLGDSVGIVRRDPYDAERPRVAYWKEI